MAENNKFTFNKNRIDFLSDDLFIYWRINPTQELNDYWENYIKKNPQLNDSFLQAIKEFNEIRHETHQYTQHQLQVKHKIEKSLLANKRKKIIYYSSAAAVALLLGISTLFFPIDKSPFKTQSEEVFVLGNTVSNNEIKLFSGGEVMNLNNNAMLNLSQKNSSVIIQDSLSQKEVKLQENTTNKLIIPYGRRSSLTLADGSKVWLNSGTEIEFPSAFATTKREIKVSGEIYIEVAKQEKPFIIHTPNSHIQVFGTSFNLSAYKDDNKESVVLVEGSVRIKSIATNASLVLSPNQIAEIENGNISSKTVDISEYTSWRNGFMQFNKVRLDEVLKKIGRYYNVEFRYVGNIDLTTKTCSGKLFLSDDIEDVLKAFTDITLLNYEKESNNIIKIKID